MISSFLNMLDGFVAIHPHQSQKKRPYSVESLKHVKTIPILKAFRRIVRYPKTVGFGMHK